MLEFDLGVEDDIVVELVRWGEDEAGGIKACLPLAIGRWVLPRTEVEFPIGADPEARDGGGRYPEQILSGRRRRFERGRVFGAEIAWRLRKMGTGRAISRPRGWECLQGMPGLGRTLAMKLALKRLDASLHPLELLQQLIVGRPFWSSILLTSLLRKRAARGQCENRDGRKPGQRAGPNLASAATTAKAGSIERTFWHRYSRAGSFRMDGYK